MFQAPHVSDPAVILVMQRQAQALTQLLGGGDNLAGVAGMSELSVARRQQQLLGQYIQQLEQSKFREQAAAIAREEEQAQAASLNAVLKNITELQAAKATLQDS